ncbi:MAG: PilT/PilU family type 4a pilus ATPase [Desulfobacteraceae bacterium]|jgi:twitching motility protein PilT
MFESLIRLAKAKGASDLHLESGLPPALRIDGELKTQGNPIGADALLAISRKIIGESNWPHFLEMGAYDLSITIQKVRCRINILKTFRGIGMAVRVLSAFQPTLEKLNLHPDLLEILRHPHGLVLVSGPTGSGKSSTMAALIQEINLRQAKHIITIENPIEYYFGPKRAFIRQREVGRDTPSFSRGLVDALREDPDVLMIGEMREAEVMRQTLNAAETGHLVLATVHSGSVIEALQRIIAAFPMEFQNGMRAQLADSLSAIICQRLVYEPKLNIRVPECEILFCNMTVKSVVRDGKLFKLNDVIQTNANEKMWSFERYRKWLDTRQNWYLGSMAGEDAKTEVIPDLNEMNLSRNSMPKKVVKKAPDPLPATSMLSKKKKRSVRAVEKKDNSKGDEYYEIGDADSDSMEDILKELSTMKKGKK